MKVKVNTFAANFNSWGNPEVAKMISDILGTDNPDKKVMIDQDKKERLYKDLSIIAAKGYKYTLKKLYENWKIANNGDYKRVVENYNNIITSKFKPFQDKIRKGNYVMVKLDDKVLILFTKNNIPRYVLRNYKSKDAKVLVKANVNFGLAKDLISNKISYKLIKDCSPIVKSHDFIFGDADEHLFEGKKITYKKSGFPMNIVDYDFNIPEFMRVKLDTSDKFKDWELLGQAVKFNKLEDHTDYAMLIKNGNSTYLVVINSDDVEPDSYINKIYFGLFQGKRRFYPADVKKASFYPIRKK